MTQPKLLRTAKRWVPREWATMNEAWLRVHAALSKKMRLTRRDVKAHLLAKRFVGAARVIAPDGSERCMIFEPAFWEPVELPYAYLESGYEKHASKGEEWHFFVRRRELDRHYPVTAASEQPTTPATRRAHDHLEPTPQRRKPGRKITKDWRLFAAHAAYEFKKRTRATAKRTGARADLRERARLSARHKRYRKAIPLPARRLIPHISPHLPSGKISFSRIVPPSGWSGVTANGARRSHR